MMWFIRSNRKRQSDEVNGSWRIEGRKRRRQSEIVVRGIGISKGQRLEDTRYVPRGVIRLQTSSYGVPIYYNNP